MPEDISSERPAQESPVPPPTTGRPPTRLPSPDPASRLPAGPPPPNLLDAQAPDQHSLQSNVLGSSEAAQQNGPQMWHQPVAAQSPPQTSGEEKDGFDWSCSRWGLGDLLLSLPVVIVSLIVSALAGFALTRFVIIELFQSEASEATRSSMMGSALGISTLLGFQAALFGWPLIVAKWKGRGAAADFGLRFRWIDLVIGPASAIGMLIGAGILTQLVAWLVGLEDVADASNTDILTSSDGGFARNLLFFSVIVGAPFCEELFFRGLAMRAIHKRFGLLAGWVGSTLLFAAPHFQAGSWQAVVTLLSSIAIIGSALGALAAWTKRLGPGIIAHMCFNGIAVLVTVFADELSDLESAFAAIAVLF